ncbi:MAG: hypothetical protein M1338_01015, partial [Patescibacteria group bacterium]|nr:hypothetical protein [Patescibacteria group bacterium]
EPAYWILKILLYHLSYRTSVLEGRETSSLYAMIGRIQVLGVENTHKKNESKGKDRPKNSHNNHRNVIFKEALGLTFYQIPWPLGAGKVLLGVSI